MKGLVRLLLVVLLLAGALYAYMLYSGENVDSLLNTPKRIEIQTDCSEIEDMLLKSVVSLKIKNNFNRLHSGVKVRITGYDENGEIVKTKVVELLRELQPNQELIKPVILPAGVQSCDCVVIDSNTE